MKEQTDIFDVNSENDPEERSCDAAIGERIGKHGIWLGKERRIYDTRNKLNDLTGKEWLQRTKSVWTSERCVEDRAAFAHPAPFLIKDIRRLITMFTKKGMLVLDPFAGSGTTLMAAAMDKRNAIGIDLSSEYLALAVSRLKDYLSGEESMLFNPEDLGDGLAKYIPDIQLDAEAEKEWNSFLMNATNNHIVLQSQNGICQALLEGNSKLLIRDITEIDYCVTSPPYHNILRNKGEGVRHDGSQTRQGVEYYSEYPDDLGNQESYQNYLNLLRDIFVEVYKKLRNNKYCTIIISDFTVDKRETNAHGDVINIISDIGFVFMGATILVQDSKVLYPFGYPYQFRINHVHQYLLNFLKN